MDKLKQVFENIYKSGSWAGSWNAGNGSGAGSEPENTASLRRTLIDFIKRHNVTSILDTPCGACKWTAVLLDELAQENIRIRYHGIDVAAQAAERAQAAMQRHEPFHTVTIAQANLATDSIPAGFDLVLCRDTMQHLSHAAGLAVLRNLATANAAHYLIGGYVPGDNNNITDGHTYKFNPSLPPFNMPPDQIIPEGDPCHEWPKHLFHYHGPSFAMQAPT